MAPKNPDVVQLTPLEALGIAIKAEIEAAQTYERLANLVKNRALKAKAHFLQEEELKHRALLEKAYARQFPDVGLVLPGCWPGHGSTYAIDKTCVQPVSEWQQAGTSSRRNAA